MDAILKNSKERMEKSIDSLVREYGSVRAGRANPAVLDRLVVDYYGSPTPINQVGSVSVPEPRMLMIVPWDKTVLKDVEKAINASDIGINPQNDGESIRLAFPPLTEERRRDLVKGISKSGEDAKVAIRSIRRDAMDELKKLGKASGYSEDAIKQEEEKVQKLTDEYCAKIDKIAKEKEKEIMEI